MSSYLGNIFTNYHSMLLKSNQMITENVMHGNEPIYNCYDITFSAILLQIIWDIINNEAFIEKI